MIAAVAMALALVGVHAQGSGQSWVPVVRSDLAGTPDFANRNPTTLDLVQTGDFNGDGRPDRAYVARNQGQQQYGIVICLSRPGGGCVEQLLASGPFKDVKTLGIGKISRSVARETLSGPRYAAAREKLVNSPAAEFLHVFAFEASDALYVWTGTTFDRVQVTD
jgi:hypothetical protein